MKYLNYSGLQTLISTIKGNLSSFTETVIPTFEEVYTNLFSLDQTIDDHIGDKVTDENGSHGIRYYNGNLEYKNGSTWDGIAVGGSAGGIFGNEESSTASRTYNVGEYIVKDGVLYKVTQTTTSGETWSTSTNIVATTITQELYQAASLPNGEEAQW